jgi:hypothetical protein
MVGSPAAPHSQIAQKVLFVCGILASLVWLGTDTLAALHYEGYSYPFDPISGLTAIGSPTRPFAVPLLGFYLGLKIAFAWGIWISAGQKRALHITAGLLFAFGLTDFVSFFFPWHPAEPVGMYINVMHGILAGGITVLLILLTIGFGASAGGKWFRIYSYGTLLVMIVMGALPLLGGFQIAADQIPEWFGAGERINAYGFMLWLVVLAIVLLRIQPKNLSVQDSERLVNPERVTK